jgi:dTDP-4-dehydrorhamnose reductase
MKILILGKGYIGNYLAPFLKKQGHNVFQFSKQTLNYSDPSLLGNYLKNVEAVDWVINCSGFTGTPNVDSCEDHKEECYYYNVTVPLYITKVCNELNIPIIHIGSGCVYSGYNKIYTENDPTDFGADNPHSSTYSKTKDTFEKLSQNMKRYIFRIRIPFNGVYEPKNYLYKLYKYNNLITKQNSITCVDDLLVFVDKFIQKFHRLNKSNDGVLDNYGVYNVVNTGSIDGAEVVDMLTYYNVVNPDWKFVTIQQANFRVARSNCILSTQKLEDLKLSLPPVWDSLNKAIYEFSQNIERN